MARRSGLVTYPVSAMPWATGDDGQPIVGQLAVGLVQLTHPDHPLPADATHPEPRHVFEVEPGRGIARLPNAGRVGVEVLGTPWQLGARAQQKSAEAAYYTDAEWDEEVRDEFGTRTERRRGRMVEVPKGVTPIATGLPVHHWAGDEA